METKFDVKGYANAWNTHDASKISAYYAENAETIVLPNPTPYRGKEGVRRAIKETFDAVPDVNGDVAWSIQEGNRAAALLHVTGRHTGPLVLDAEHTVEATGKSVSFELGCFWELDAAGKILKETQVADSATLLMQVGVLGGETKTGTKASKEPIRSERAR